MFEFKVMDAGHHEEAFKLWEETVGTGPNDTKEAIIKYLKRNEGMSFVCILKETGKVIGTVLGGNDGRHGYIYHLAVSVNYRGNRIGTTLAKLSADAIKKNGMLRCIIGVKNGNEDFWVKIGWRKLDELNMYSAEV